jgi:hypothetical protein
VNNPVEIDETGFGFRSGMIWRRALTTEWFWLVGSEYARGPYSSKAKARASANRYLKSLDRKAS